MVNPKDELFLMPIYNVEFEYLLMKDLDKEENERK
jgi:hypothetical protein